MLSLADMINLFAHEFSGLRRRSLALGGVLARPIQCFLFRHFVYLSAGKLQHGMSRNSGAIFILFGYRADLSET
jgi:hypothetical protein